MSKIIEKYNSLKEEDSQKIYLFKNGIFYIFLNEDAKIIHEKLGLKIIDFGLSSIKCGFPSNNLEKYLDLLEKHSLNYQIIDDNKKIDNKNDYLNNIICKEILKEIKEINMNETTFKQAFEKLLDYQNRIKNIQ